MYRIVVFFSLCYDWDLLPGNRSSVSSPDDLSHLPRKLDAYSEAALEYAFRLRDQITALGRTVQIQAITSEQDLPDFIAKNLFAVGADQVFTLQMDGDPMLTPANTAAALSAYLGQQDWDLILTGYQDSTTCDIALPVLLSRALRTPFLGPLFDLIFEADGLHIVRTLPEYTQTAVITCPAVCAIGNCEHPYLRLATLREKLSVMDRKAEVVSVPFVPASDPVLLHFSPRSSGRKTKWISDGDTNRKALQILDIILTGKEDTSK